MSDFEKKIEDLNNRNNSTLNELFGLFGKSKKGEEGNSSDSNPDSIIKHTGNVSYNLNGNPIEHVDSGAKHEWLNYDWENGKLSWLANSKFRCTRIKVDFSKEKLEYFFGEWLDGEFKQGRFTGYPDSKFISGTFIGTFEASYKNWIPSPTRFLEGKWLDGDNGILGQENLKALSFTVGNPSQPFNIIRIPPGYSIKLKTLDNEEYVISTIKRLDSKSSNFSYSVYDVLNKSSRVVNLPWSQIRGGSDSVFLQNTLIDITKTKSLPLFNINMPSGIYSIEVGASSNFAQKPSQPSPEEAKKPALTKFVINNKGWGSPSGYLINKSVLGDENIMEKISEFSDDINSGKFFNHLRFFKKLMQQGRVDGYGKYPALSYLFPKKIGELYKQQDDKRDSTMKYFSDFSENVIDNLQSANISKFYEEKIRKELGIKSSAAKSTAKPTPKKPSAKPTPKKPNVKSKKKKVTGAVPKPLKEDVSILKDEIRNIIKDSF